MHRHEGRAEAVHAGEVLVAIALVDLPLTAELGLERLDRHAVARVRAVAAALANGVVDEHALGGIGEGAALAPAALLGGTGLVVDQHGEPGNVAQLALDGIELVAM